MKGNLHRKVGKSMNTRKKEEETYEKNKKICKLCAGGMHGCKPAGERSGRDGIGGRTRRSGNCGSDGNRCTSFG